MSSFMYGLTRSGIENFNILCFLVDKSDDDTNLGNLVQNHLMVLHGLMYVIFIFLLF